MHRTVLATLAAPVAMMGAALPVAAQTGTPAKAPTTAPAKAPTVGPPAPTIATLPPKPGPVSKNAPVNGVLVLYGNERCPTDTAGNEIVICERRGAQEQFRVPKELREFKVTAENQSWSKQAEGTLATGASGIGSCSAIGPGGSLGCSQQQFRAAKADNRERKKEEQAGTSDQ